MVMNAMNDSLSSDDKSSGDELLNLNPFPKVENNETGKRQPGDAANATPLVLGNSWDAHARWQPCQGIIEREGDGTSKSSMD